MQRQSKKKLDWWLYTVPILFLLMAAVHIMLYSRPGIIGIIIYYMGPLLVVLFAIIFLIIAIIYSLIYRPFFSKWRLVGFIGLIVFPLTYLLRAEQSGTLFNAYPSSHYNKPSSIRFRIPFDTTITVGWGGDHADVNYHVTSPEQRWAYDLLIETNGSSYSGDSSKVENYFCYGLPVLAPCPAKVVKVFDVLKDMPIGDLTEESEPSGNHIVLEVAKKEFLYLCHLKPKSIQVKEGDLVEEGQKLAEVGNSGHSSEPHLHIHLQDAKGDFAEGIPLFFYHYLVNGAYIERGMPTGGFDKLGNLTGQTVKNLQRR